MEYKRDSLGDRMKAYEEVSKTVLMKRTPVIIRIDGKAFHTFTRGFQKPFDQVLVKTMQETTKYLCENIQGCVFGYTQSDEITLVLCDYQTYETCPWYDYEVQKLCSISASMATMKFNQLFYINAENYIAVQKDMSESDMSFDEEDKKKWAQYEIYRKAYTKGAMFDARCFNVSKEEVANNILWRSNDATRNSIQMLARAYFSHKELHAKNSNDIQEMLWSKYNINWNDTPIHLKRGTAIIKDENGKWFIDLNMPIISQDRDYIERRINFE